MSESILQFDPVLGYWFVALVAVALVSLLWLGPDRKRTSAQQRWILTGVRLLVIAVILITMLRPARVVTEMKELAATLVVLVDSSRSMQVADAFGGKTRWEELQTRVKEIQPLLDELGDQVQVKAYHFDQTLHPLEVTPEGIKLPDKPTGQQTAIGAALEDMLRREAGQRLLACILMSDGAQRAYAPYDLNPRTAVRSLVERDAPLQTIAFGEARGIGQARDLAVIDLVVSPTVFVKNQLDVSGILRIDGYPGREIPVELLFETAPGKMEVVAATRVRAAEDGAQLPVQLSYIPQTPGEYKLTLKAASQDGELVTRNNELSTFVTVLGGGLNVLSIAGGIPLEQSRTARAIDASANIHVQTEYFDKRGRKGWPIDAKDWFEPGKFDVYLIGDLDSEAFTTQDWQKLADAVDNGAGLIMLGGTHSFAPGGFGKTPLADVLPIEMGRLDLQRFDEPTRMDLHVKGPLRMMPEKIAGRIYPFLDIGSADQNDSLWNALPPLDGANKFDKLKPNADVAAVGVASSGAKIPVLVAGGWGGGRVLAMAADSTWRWPLAGHGTEHRRFWRQLILWLAHIDASQDGNVWVDVEERRHRPGGRVKFNVGAESPEGQPIPGATFQAEVIAPDGSRKPVSLTRQAGEMVGTYFDTRNSGDYTIVVRASNSDGSSIGEAKARFLVFQQDLELDNPAADPDLLSSLSAMTSGLGGRKWPSEQLGELMQELRDRPREFEIETQRKVTYWDRWPVFLVFTLLVSLEWFLRKKWGLV